MIMKEKEKKKKKDKKEKKEERCIRGKQFNFIVNLVSTSYAN